MTSNQRKKFLIFTAVLIIIIIIIHINDSAIETTPIELSQDQKVKNFLADFRKNENLIVLEKEMKLKGIL